MFIAEVYPIWGFVIAVVAFFIGFLLSFFFSIYRSFVSSFFNGLMALAVASVFVVFIVIVAPIENESFTNPNERPSLSMFAYVNKEKMNDTIAESINVEKVSVDMGDGDSRVVKSMGEGDIFDFTGIDNGSKIEGSLYFTDDSVEIIVESKENIKEEFSIPLN